MNDTIFGKRILVGLTYLDASGGVAKQIQLHGIISRLAAHSLYFERADGNGEFSIPFDGELDVADPDSTYTLRSTGETITGVHFIASWTIHPNLDQR
ncbi:hypothetical protein [Pseudoduganella violaceinigra]|uniref:hypothetical protein n=1 Tax=Pseudoduganella violaceinigra TaxID=246602 RepID=UPI0012B647E4|nr:hypothetical protein [Pseudoduganella violaceinigra]